MVPRIHKILERALNNSLLTHKEEPSESESNSKKEENRS
jgi:hypothetical protein